MRFSKGFLGVSRVGGLVFFEGFLRFSNKNVLEKVEEKSKRT